jgi:hypothetical protein
VVVGYLTMRLVAGIDLSRPEVHPLMWGIALLFVAYYASDRPSAKVL